jgi:hypothetical protein
MKMTLEVDGKLLERASALTGVKDKTSLARMGLEALVRLESGRRLARLGGTEMALSVTRRRRAGKF